MLEQITFDLYAVNLASYSGTDTHPHTPRMATVTFDADLIGYIRRNESSKDMRPMSGSPATWYRLHLVDLADHPIPGWVTCKAMLTVDNYSMDWLPLSWYQGEPTDWTTGMARYLQPDQYDRAGKLVPGPTWILSARRSS